MSVINIIRRGKISVSQKVLYVSEKLVPYIKLHVRFALYHISYICTDAKFRLSDLVYYNMYKNWPRIDTLPPSL